MECARYGKLSYIGDYKIPRPSSLEGLPSPATSGYSGLGSDADSPLSGDSMEIQTRPEVAHYATPISSYCERAALSNEARRTSSSSLEANKSAKSSKRSSQSVPDGAIVLDRRVLRALLLCVRETRARLDENETKLRNMEKKLATFRDDHNKQMVTLVKSLLAVKIRQQKVASHPVKPTLPVEEKKSFPDFAEESAAGGAASGATERSDQLQCKEIRDEPELAKEVALVTTPVESISNAAVFACDAPEPSTVLRSPTNKPDALGAISPSQKSVAVSPLYAVVKKKRKLPDSSSLESESCAKSPLVTQQSVAEKAIVTPGSNSLPNLEGNSCVVSVQLAADEPDQYRIKSVRVENRATDIGVTAVSQHHKSEPDIVLESQSKMEDRSNPSKVQSKPLFSDTHANNMTARCTGDGFFISDSFTRAGNYGKNGKFVVSHTNHQDRENSPQNQRKPTRKPTDAKSVALLSRFKKKIKDTTRKVSRAGSKDSVGSDAPSASESYSEGRVDVTLTTGDVTVISCTDDASSYDVFQPSEGLEALHQTSYITYSPRLGGKKAPAEKLGSTGDEEHSRKSPHLSSSTLNDQNSQFGSKEVDMTGYETVSFSTAESPSSFSHRPPLKAPSSPNLASSPQISPVRRTRSSGAMDWRRSATKSDSSLTSIVEDEIALPQTVVNALYKQTDRPSSVERNGYSLCDVSEDKVAEENKDDDDDVFAKNISYILDDVTRQQNEMEKLASGISPGEPPPKPNRPGVSSGKGYPPSSGGPVYTATGQPGMYPPSGGRFSGIGMPPTNPVKIMTPEELENHEAQLELQRRQFEEAELHRQIARQKAQASEDDEWIKEQEMNPEIPPFVDGAEDEDPEHPYYSADDMRKARASGSSAPPKPSRQPPSKEPVDPTPKVKFEEVKPTPTMKLDREGDGVYRDTMGVVKSVLQTNHDVMEASPDEIFLLVKNIGKSLKELCTSLDQEMPSLPEQFHREIDMAQKTTNKDLSQIIHQMKLVKKFIKTTQVNDYKKCLMAANQVLAMDAKNLLDVVDKARFYKLEHEPAAAPPSAAESSSPVPQEREPTPPPSATTKEEEG